MAQQSGAASKPGAEISPAHPFIAAKPPTTDALTYLTLLEFNVTKENVVVLRHVLQEDVNTDGILVEEIGWDLVSLLTKFVDVLAARETLVDIAKLGNPRECALKVEEGLRGIDWEAEPDEDGDGKADQPDVHPALRIPNENADSQTPRKGVAPEGKDTQTGFESSLPFAQFTTLMSMLAILHPRIKTKQPSKFIATTLSAVLAAMAGAPPQHHQACVDEALKLVQSLKNSQRPSLPPRTPSRASDVRQEESGVSSPAQSTLEPQQEPLDAQTQRKLLKSFITHVAELWMSSLDGSLEQETIDVPALAWAPRFQEQAQPGMVVPDRPSMTELFEQVKALRRRDECGMRLLAVAQSLGLGSEELLEAAMGNAEESRHDSKGETGSIGDAEDANEAKDEDEPPEKPEDVPLSPAGCLFLFAYEQFILNLRSTDQSASRSADVLVFPHVSQLLATQIGSPEDVMVSTAIFPNAFLDSLFLLGLVALSQDAVGDPDEAFPDDKDAFSRLLQVTSLLSANIPNASLRYCAHVITATVLRSHPEPVVRLNFIRDTLENGPVDLLKAEAVGWLKGEIVEANLASNASEDDHSIFKTSMALDSVSIYLYPDLQTMVPNIMNRADGDAATDPVSIFAEAVKPALPFFLAVLNFHFLLLSMPAEIRERLDIFSLHNEADIGTGFLTPLREVARKTEEALKKTLQAEGEAIQQTKSDVMLLGQAIEQVERRLVVVAREGK